MVNPINEISFLAWHSGDVRGTVPFLINSGFDIKYHLCKAAIEGIKAIRSVDSDCRILLSEPLVKVHPRDGEPMSEAVAQKNEDQFQAMDMIGGFMCPELGGEPDLLDILGFNYYHNCQWQYEGEPLCWEIDTRQRVPLSELLLDAYSRYQRPIVLSETGHFGNGRAKWLLEVFNECLAAIKGGVDLKGICLYPLIDRPDWDNIQDYHNSGLWDIDPQTKHRTLNEPYLEALLNCQRQLAIFEAAKEMPIALSW
jgi:beta-glucosidase/6-phospho-beta-glucosidase/beta-galactosidase